MLNRYGIVLGLIMSLSGSALAQGGAPPPAAPPPGPPPGAPPPAYAAPPPPAPVEPAGARTHDGFFMRFGLNFGYGMNTESYESSGGVTVATPDLKIKGLATGFDFLLGGTPAPGFVIGGGIVNTYSSHPSAEQGPIETELDGTLLVVNLVAFVNYYLDPHEGLNFQALGGFGVMDFVTDSGRSGGNDPTGFVLGAGVGYEFWVGNQWSIGPFGRFIYGKYSGGDGITFTESYIYPSVGATFTLH